MIVINYGSKNNATITAMIDNNGIHTITNTMYSQLYDEEIVIIKYDNNTSSTPEEICTKVYNSMLN